MRLPTVFLDRDGVLTREEGYVCSLNDLHIFPYAEECIKIIHAKGYLAIVVTNQGGIAKELFTEQNLMLMNTYLMQETGVDAIYYCPHHPEGINPQYAKSCHCRKPDIGLLERAGSDFQIDIERSYMVGDRASDIEFGLNAGMTTVLLESGYGLKRLEKKIEPNYIYADLREFSKFLPVV